MIKFTISVLLSLIALSLFANNTILLDSAKKHYEQKAYQKAITNYETIIADGYSSSEVYYNLGNAYFKLNNLGKAILYYEKAKKINPSDEDITYNLSIANQKRVDKIDAIPQLFIKELQVGFINTFSEKTWSVLSIVFMWLAFGLLLLYFFTSQKKIKLIGFWSAMLLFAFTIATYFIAQKSNQLTYKADEAIILVPSITAKGSPADDGTNLFVLHEGTKVQIETESNGWIEIKLANGNKGWVKIETIGKI